MCKDCGCEEGNAVAFQHHRHAHSHSHSHTHGHHTHEPDTRTIAIETRVMAENDAVAAANRSWLQAHNIASVNLISAPGSGKTMLLEATLDALAAEIPLAVITGDQQTENDARRLQGRGANVIPIETQSSCHLSAQHIADRLPQLHDHRLRLLVIENVGNLVCPAAFDLGEDSKVALVSVTEGEDKPVKYPALFHDAPVTVVTKADLLPYLDVDLAQLKANIRMVRPDARIIVLSARHKDAGFEEWLAYLKNLV